MRETSFGDLSRRDFVALSAVAGLAAATGLTFAADLPVVETSVLVKTPDGTCDAVFIHPMTGTHPGVLIWPDAFGLRPAMRHIGKRIAAEGYSVLVPNPFYRVAKAPVFDDISTFDFQNPGRHGETAAVEGVIERRRCGGARCRRLCRISRCTATG
jgi:carboxymethylenebutenolidase